MSDEINKDTTLGEMAEVIEEAGGIEEFGQDLAGEDSYETPEDAFMEDSTKEFLDSMVDAIQTATKGFTISQIPAYLRTYVPVLWGAFITWLVATLPWIPQGLQDWLTSGEVVLAVGVVVTALWYALWKWLEPRLPAWLTRLLMGSNQTPTYSG